MPKKSFFNCRNFPFGLSNSMQSSLANFSDFQDFSSLLLLMQMEFERMFKPPAALHFSGSRERLEQIIKLPLLKVIGSRTFSFDILWTLVCEIECNMNSRPLINVPKKINDPLALTPI